MSAKKKAKAARGGVGESKKSGSAKARSSAKPSKAREAAPGGAHQKVTSQREDTRRTNVKSTADRNRKDDKNDKKDKGKSTYELESSNPEKRPSRKSTRGGANHAKPDSQLRRQTTRAVRSPKNRSQMRGG